jgi:tetratricopeptide (TPR) repeat protein
MALVLWKQRDFEGSLAECALALAPAPDSEAMIALQAIALWQLNRKKESQAAFKEAARIDPKVGTSEVFCRLLACDARDIGVVADFLRRNRWVIAPNPEP